MAVTFKIVKYGNLESNLTPSMDEVAAHFDRIPARHKKQTSVSLHTEYCFAGRKSNEGLLENADKYSALINSFIDTTEYKTGENHKIPLLWSSEEWSNEFADFVIEFSHKLGVIPKLVEIHPPFKDQVNWDDFVTRYKIFEDKLTSVFNDIEILIENRCGTLYQGSNKRDFNSPFLLSRTEGFQVLSNLIRLNDLKLNMILDLPQLLRAHQKTHGLDFKEVFPELMKSINLVNNHIGAVHLWGYGPVTNKYGEIIRAKAHYGGIA
jgi:hypothetical protein